MTSAISQLNQGEEGDGREISPTGIVDIRCHRDKLPEEVVMWAELCPGRTAYKKVSGESAEAAANSRGNRVFQEWERALGEDPG